MKKMYMVEAFKYGDISQHSYVVGVCSDLNMANSFLTSEELYKGGMYKCRIVEILENEKLESLKIVKDVEKVNPVICEIRNVIYSLHFGNSQVSKVLGKFNKLKEKLEKFK